jgi:hypothetical protein
MRLLGINVRDRHQFLQRARTGRKVLTFGRQLGPYTPGIATHWRWKAARTKVHDYIHAKDTCMAVGVEKTIRTLEMVAPHSTL